MTRSLLLRPAVSAALIAAILLALPAASEGQNTTRSRPGNKAVGPEGGPRDFRSQRFLIHADLTDEEAKDAWNSLADNQGRVTLKIKLVD